MIVFLYAPLFAIILFGPISETGDADSDARFAHTRETIIVAAIFLGAGLQLLSAFEFMRGVAPHGSTAEDMSVGREEIDRTVARAVESLSVASLAISEISGQVETKKVTLDQLEKAKQELDEKKAQAERAIELSKEQVQAVTSLFEQKLVEQNKQNTRITWIQGVIFFVLGVLTSIVVSLVLA